jgi:DNA replication and repair protein RecF
MSRGLGTGSSMRLAELRLRDFRNLESVDLVPGPGANLVVGGNGTGKTALLESIFFLGRGRSFRSSRSRPLIRVGSKGLSVYGRVVAQSGREHRLGIGLEGKERRIRIDGREGGRASELAEKLAMGVLVPQSHEILDRGPEVRRKLIDWGVFHVEPGYGGEVRRYLRALQQRNTCIKDHASGQTGWDAVLAEAGEKVQAARAALVARLNPELARLGGELLGEALQLELRPGWPGGEGRLRRAIAESSAADRARHFTSVGPHRADLRVTSGTRFVRDFSSRGQQKLVVGAILIAIARVVSRERGEPMVFLVDDFASELDRASRERLWYQLRGLCCQCFLTGIDMSVLPSDSETRVFHVEHGALTRG